MQKLINLLKSKRFWIIFMSLIILFGLYLIVKLNNKLPQESPIPNPQTATPTQAVKIPVSTQLGKEGSYYLNVIVGSKTPVTGYSWTDNGLIYYSTPKGIYKASDNTAIMETKIDAITWSNQGTALYKNSGKWWLLKTGEKEPLTLNFNPVNPLLNPRGNFIAYYQGKTLYLYDITANSSKKHDFGENIDRITWSEDSEDIAINTSWNNLGVITVLDSSLELKISDEFEKGSVLLSLSPTAKKFAFQIQKGIVIYDIESAKTEINEIKDDSKAAVTWVNDDIYILTETYKDELGRQVDEFNLISPNNKKVYAANSNPIINKLNLNIPLKVNRVKNTVLFAENNSKLWLLSLFPKYFPTYSYDGLHITPIESGSDSFIKP